MVRKGEYKFKKNLLLLSDSKNLEEAMKEWVKVDEHKTKSRCNRCLCQHTLKYMNIIYNIKTRKYAGIGDTCYKHITHKNNQFGQSGQTGQSGKNDQKGEYEDIDDLNKYSDDIKKIFEMNHKTKFENKLNQCDTSSKLNDLLIEIKECQLNNLGDICSSVNNKLMTIEEANNAIEKKNRDLYEQRKKKYYDILTRLLINKHKRILIRRFNLWREVVDNSKILAEYDDGGVKYSLGIYKTQKEANNAIEKKRESYEQQQKKKFYNIPYTAKTVMMPQLVVTHNAVTPTPVRNNKHHYADFIYNNVPHSIGPYDTQSEADNVKQDFLSKKGVGYTKKKERRSDGKTSKFLVYKNDNSQKEMDVDSDDSSFDGNDY